MPVYQYRCPDGHTTEELLSIKDMVSTIQCSCGKIAARVFTPSVIHGIPFQDFKREYLAHTDKYPDAESNIRFCEEFTGKSRNDPELETLGKRRVKWQ